MRFYSKSQPTFRDLLIVIRNCTLPFAKYNFFYVEETPILKYYLRIRGDISKSKYEYIKYTYIPIK